MIVNGYEIRPGADLKGADFEGADLRGASLHEANAAWVNFEGAQLQGVNLEGANLVSANLKGADLEDASLMDANAACANFEGANLCDVVARCADLQSVKLEGANLEGTDLRCTNLYGAGEWGGLVFGAGADGDGYLVPTPAGWRVTLDYSTAQELDWLRDLIADRVDWPGASGPEPERRRPMIRAVLALCEAHIAQQPADIIDGLAERWGRVT
jgi:uncharacterized protein YjbI with pentapeptide repeats